MLTFIYSKKFYNFIKSGLLVDFYFKRFIYLIITILFKNFNIFFSEKYFIEYFFLKSILYLDFLKYLFNSFSNYFSYYMVGIIILWICIVLIIIYISV